MISRAVVSVTGRGNAPPLPPLNFESSYGPTNCLFSTLFHVILLPQILLVYPKSTENSFEKNCFSTWASTLNMGLINKVDMVCLLPVGYGV